MASETERKPKRKPAPKQREKSKLTKIGALWVGSGKNGKFMSGRIELGEDNEMRILVFKNGYKEKDNQPDYVIYEPSPEGEETEDPLAE
jgi:hypothetical protein